MIQKTFGIYNDVDGSCKFYIELGHDHIACWCVDKGEALKTFEFFSFQNNGENFAETYRQVKLNSTILNNEYEDTFVIWENENCICIPNDYFSSSSAHLYLSNIVGDKLHAMQMHDKVDDKIVAYKVSGDHLRLVEDHFPNAQQLHKYTTLVKSVNQSSHVRTFIKTVFYQNHFLLMAVEDGVLKLIQTFNYKTSEDVIYHILNTTVQLKMDAENTEVIVSGLIDLQSVLYRELYKYIHQLKVDTLPDNTASATHEYPEHYLLPFYKYAV